MSAKCLVDVPSTYTCKFPSRIVEGPGSYVLLLLLLLWGKRLADVSNNMKQVLGAVSAIPQTQCCVWNGQLGPGRKR